MMKKLAYRFLAVCFALVLLTTQVLANYWVINSYRFGAAALPAPTLTFLQCAAQNGTDGTTMTFASQNTGTFAANRYIIIGWQVVDASGTYFTSGVTLGGVAAELVRQTDNQSIDYWFNNGFAVIANPAASSASVVLTMSETVSAARICMWAATDISMVPFNMESREAAGGAVINMSLNVPASGFVVGVCGNPSTSGTWTWTGGLTERLDNASSEMQMTAADYTNDTVMDFPLTITADPTNTADNGCTVAAFGNPVTTPIINFLACAGSQTDAASYSFTNMFLSVADSSRAIITVVGGRDSPNAYTISTLTVAGNSATEVSDISAVDEMYAGGTILALASGSSGTVAVTMSETIQTLQICMWAVYNVSDLTLVDSASIDIGSASGPHPMDIDIRQGGVAVGYCNTEDTGSGALTGWAVMSEDSNVEVSPGGTGSMRASSASVTNYGAGMFPASPSCYTPSGGIGNSVGLVLSFGGATDLPVDVSFMGCTFNSTNTTTYSFASTPIGAAAADRTLLIMTLGQDGTDSYTMNGLTVDGNAAAEQLDVNGAANQNNLSVYSLAWATGTTATIAATNSEAITGMGICVWAAYGLSSATATASTPLDSSGSATVTYTLNTNISAEGVAIAGCIFDGDRRLSSWKGVTQADEDYLESGSADDFSMTVGSFIIQGSAGATPLPMSCTRQSGTVDGVGGAATFR